MRIAAHILVFIVAVSTLEGAPAPQFKGLPEEVENVVRAYTVAKPKSIESVKQDIQTSRTIAERDRHVRDLALLQWECYTMPVVILQDVRRDPRYQSYRDQEAIQRALDQQRQRYSDAKRVGLFKPERPPPEPKPKGWHHPVPPPKN